MSSDLIVRALDASSLDDYKRIRLEALHNEPFAFSGDFADEAAKGDDFHAMRLQMGTVFGAYIDNKLAGMVGAFSYQEKKLRHRAAIWGVYVSPEYRGRKIARSLIVHALDHLPGHVTHISLGVADNNDVVRRLYESLGFEVYGHEMGTFCHDGVLCNEYLMMLRR